MGGVCLCVPHTSSSCFLVLCEVSVVCILSVEIWNGGAELIRVHCFWLLLLLLRRPAAVLSVWGPQVGGPGCSKGLLASRPVVVCF